MAPPDYLAKARSSRPFGNSQDERSRLVHEHRYRGGNGDVNQCGMDWPLNHCQCKDKDGSIIAHVDTATSQAIVGEDRVYVIGVSGNTPSTRSPRAIVPMTGKKAVIEFDLTRAE